MADSVVLSSFRVCKLPGLFVTIVEYDIIKLIVAGLFSRLKQPGKKFMGWLDEWPEAPPASFSKMCCVRSRQGYTARAGRSVRRKRKKQAVEAADSRCHIPCACRSVSGSHKGCPAFPVCQIANALK